MNIETYAYEEYVQLVTSFHGNLAPGLLFGGFIVDLVKRTCRKENFSMPSANSHRLPDAVQLLTPCTIGNGRLKILDFGRFAVMLYEKNAGAGVRVNLRRWQARSLVRNRSWFFKLKPKEQDFGLLMLQIKEAGHRLLSIQRVRVDPEKLRRPALGSVDICPECGEPIR